MSILRTVILAVALISFSFTVFAFEGHRKYIKKFNPQIKQPEIYIIGESITKAANKFDFDPILILAVMKTESHFDIDAYNKWDARGLMQIRVPVWFKVLKKKGLMKSWQDFYNPKRNTLSGTYILSVYRRECNKIDRGLKCMLQRYNGDRGGHRYYDNIMKSIRQYDHIYRSIVLVSNLNKFTIIKMISGHVWPRTDFVTMRTLNLFVLYSSS